MPQTTTGSATSLAGKKVLVMGLGRFGGGIGVTRWLLEQGARVTVNDAANAEQLADSLRALEGLPITFKLGSHDPADFLAADLIVVNPAVDRSQSAPLKAAQNAGVPLTSEINLFLSRCAARTVGITGSVGKSTTTALIYAALKAAFHQSSDHPAQESPRTFLGGNIGRSLLLDLPQIRPQDIVVLELSSFMLDQTPEVARPDQPGGGWSPHIAVVTNIFPNHLDRHGTMAAYAAAKQNILRHQHPGDFAILNGEHELVSRWAGLAQSRGARVVKYTTRGPAQHRPKLVIPGEHNASNAAAAIAVLDALSSLPSAPPLDRPAALAAIESFPGLAHRLQLAHSLALPGGRSLRFYNDSKATSPDASITALQAFPVRTAIFIVGGYDKHIDLAGFEALLAERAAGVLGIGQTGQGIVDRVAAIGGVRAAYVGNLAAAVATAADWAKKEMAVESIVLSPASASWDQFPNYEIRGEQFAQLAKQLTA